MTEIFTDRGFLIMLHGFSGKLVAVAGAAAICLGGASVAQARPLDAVSFQDVATVRCLDSNTAKNVYTNPCDKDNGFQHWQRVGLNLKDVATGLCLDSNTAHQVYTNPCDTNNGFQHWERSGQNLKDSTTGLCLDSNASGAAYTNNCDSNNRYQQWV